MPFTRPTRSELLATAVTEIETRLEGSAARLRRSPLNVLARLWAAGAHALLAYLAFISRQVFPDTAEAEFLRNWAALYGINELPANFAQGLYTFDGADLATVPAETSLRRDDGREFKTLEEAVIVAGTATVSVISLEPGEDANTDEGVKLKLLSPVVGVQLEGTIAAGGIVGGTDVESEESLRSRLVARIRRPPAGGTAPDYEARVKLLAGVTDVHVFAPLTPTVSKVSIGSTTADSLVSGLWSARGVAKRVRVIVAFQSGVLANAETVTLTAQLQDATDAAGAGAADFGAAIGPVVLATAVGAVAVSGQYELELDIQAARAFMRGRATLATSSTGLLTGWTLVLQYEGGPGEVGVAPLYSDRADPIPLAADLIAAQALLDAPEFKVLGSTPIAFALVPDVQAFTIHLVDDDPATRLAIETDLADLYRREREPGGVIPISHIRETISQAAGETDHVLTTPTADHDLLGDKLKIHALGAITWS